MNITIIQDNSRQELLDSNGASIIQKLYQLAIDPNNTLTLEGNIDSTTAYGYQVDYLNTNYGPDFKISVANRYIYFEDPNMESYLASMGIGDNGKVTEAQAAAVTVIANASNSTITKFNELKYFTNITESKNGWTGTNSGFVTFKNWTALQEIDISNFTSIGHGHGTAWEDTFAGCTSLKKVIASSKLKKLGYCAFFQCSNLEEITGLSGTIELWGNVFQDCNKLKQSSIQDCTFTYTYSTNTNFTNLFRECWALTSISLDSSITAIPKCTFYNDINLVSVSGMQNVTRYDNSCFEGCSNFEGPIDLTNVTYIDKSAFRYCNKLKFIGNTSNLQTIGELCFADTDLSGATVTINVNPKLNTFASATLPSTVTIGSQVTDIISSFSNAKGEFVVTGGSGLTNSGNFRYSEVTSVAFPNITTIDQENFRDCKKILNTSDIAFWSTLQTIGERAFQGCVFSGSISLPNIQSVGNGIFMSCQNLTSVTFGGNYSLSAGSVFIGCTNLSYVDISGFTSLGNQFFRECKSIQTLTGTSDVTYIGNECFLNSIISGGVYLPNVIEVDTAAFRGIETPKIILPKVETIASNAFQVSGNSKSAIVELGDQLQQIDAQCSPDNSELNYIIRTSTVPTMVNTFSNQKWYKTTIYVPRNMINSYKAASGWGSIQGQNGREVFYALENSAYASPTWYQNV